MAAGQRLSVIDVKTSSVPADEPGTLVGLITRSPSSFSLPICGKVLVTIGKCNRAFVLELRTRGCTC